MNQFNWIGGARIEQIPYISCSHPSSVYSAKAQLRSVIYLKHFYIGSLGVYTNYQYGKNKHIGSRYSADPIISTPDWENVVWRGLANV